MWRSSTALIWPDTGGCLGIKNQIPMTRSTFVVDWAFKIKYLSSYITESAMNVWRLIEVILMHSFKDLSETASENMPMPRFMHRHGTSIISIEYMLHLFKTLSSSCPYVQHSHKILFWLEKNLPRKYNLHFCLFYAFVTDQDIIRPPWSLKPVQKY